MHSGEKRKRTNNGRDKIREKEVRKRVKDKRENKKFRKEKKGIRNEKQKVSKSVIVGMYQ